MDGCKRISGPSWLPFAIYQPTNERMDQTAIIITIVDVDVMLCRFAFSGYFRSLVHPFVCPSSRQPANGWFPTFPGLVDSYELWMIGWSSKFCLPRSLGFSGITSNNNCATMMDSIVCINTLMVCLIYGQCHLLGVG